MTLPDANPPWMAGRTGPLATHATAAAHRRGVGGQPEVLAARVDKVRAQVDMLLAASIHLGLGFTMSHVQTFAAAGSMGWCSAWLLGPIPSLALLAVLRAEQLTARYQLSLTPWARRTKWLTFSTYPTNTWTAWGLSGQPFSGSAVIAHSVPPLVVLFAAETGPEPRQRLTDAAIAAAGHGVCHSCPCRPPQPAPAPTASPIWSREASPAAITAPPPDPVPTTAPETGPGPGAAAPASADAPEPDPPPDQRVRQVIARVAAGEAHTGQSVAALFGVSQRTGRRILAAATAHAARTRASR